MSVCYICHYPSFSAVILLSPFLSLCMNLSGFIQHCISSSLYNCLSLSFFLFSFFPFKNVGSLHGSILLLQASELRGGESDATESFYSSFNPTKCKNISTRRVLNNSKQDLVCEKDETLYEIIEEINYFMLP